MVNIEDKFNDYEIGVRDEMISKGIAECRLFLKKQKDPGMFYFYEGSIEGFEECRRYSTHSDFSNRLAELMA